MQIGMSPTEGVLEAMESIVWTLFVCMGGRGVNPQFLKVFFPILRPICMGLVCNSFRGLLKN